MSEEITGRQRRINPRFRMRLKVSYEVSGARKRAGFTSDIGPGGLFILASPPPDRGKPVRLAVTFPSGHTESMIGRVIWSQHGPPYPGMQRGGFGVELLTPSEAWFTLCATLLHDPRN